MSNYTSFSAIRAGLGASRRQDREARYVIDRFYAPLEYLIKVPTAATDSIALKTDAAINVLRTGEGNQFEVRLEQAFAGAAPQAKAHARGLQLVIDAADNDGVGLDLGYGAVGAEVAHTRGAYTIGTDLDFFVRVTLEVGDVSDSDQIAVGFAKGGWPATGLINAYTDMACLNIDNGDIKLETRLNSAGDAAVDSTQNVVDWAAAGNEVTLEVRVNSAGKVKFLINDAAPTVDVTGFTFDDGDVVNAFLLIATDIAGDPTVVVHEWESGLIASRGLEGFSDVQEAAQSTANA